MRLHLTPPLAEVEIYKAGKYGQRNPPVEAVFWSAVSQLRNLRTLEVEAIPLPLGNNLRFLHVVHLTLGLLDVEAEEWGH